MDRYSGWAQVRGTPDQPHWLPAVRALVEREKGHGVQVGLTGSGDRWHLWVEGVTPPGARSALVPFFKAVGSAASASYGVLQTERADGDRLAGTRQQRWVMVRGSVSGTAPAWDQVRA